MVTYGGMSRGPVTVGTVCKVWQRPAIFISLGVCHTDLVLVSNF